MANQGNDFPLLAKVINGGLAGMVGTTCIFPLDLVKTRLQNQRVGPNGEKLYENIFDAFGKIYRSEGFRGMYRGSFVTILLVSPEKAVKLTANDMFRHLFKAADGSISMPLQMLAGGLAGFLQIAITTPSELVKVQLQDAGRAATAAKAAGREIEHVTARTVAAHLMRERGFFGLYKGISPTAARDIPFSIIYFPLFATLNDLGPKRTDGSGESVAWWSFIGGLLAASFSAVAVTPMDVIKTRMQLLNAAADGNTACVGFYECARTTYQQEGLKAFFKGGLCRVIVLAPLFGIAQAFYLLGVSEKMLAYFRGDKSL